MVKELLIGTAVGATVLAWLWGFDVMPLLLLAGLGAFLLFSTGGGAARWGGSPGRRWQTSAAKSHARITFEDIGGQEVAKRELKEALDLLNDQDGASTLGIRPIKGVLLSGPPGTGKTLMAKAAATYTDAAFYSTSGSEFVQMYAGVGAQRVRQLFQRARTEAAKMKKHAAIIFIDEIEVMGGKRGRTANHMEYDQTLNELLVQIDGMSSDGHDNPVSVLVIAATNRPDLLDEALLRPGRFDRTVVVDMPDKEGRLHILRIHTENRPLAPEVSLDRLADETYGFSGADLENVVNEAAIYAIREGRAVITVSDLKSAVDKVMMGERLDRDLQREERDRVAYHEAGHALMTELLRPGAVASVTITPRGKALGYMRQTPRGDRYMHTKEELLDMIAIALAGMSAEELFFGSRSTGARGDLEQVMQIAGELVASGMSSLGIVDADMISSKEMHDEMQLIVQGQERFVKHQLEACREQLSVIATALLDKEKLSGEQLRSMIGPLVPITVTQGA